MSDNRKFENASKYGTQWGVNWAFGPPRTNDDASCLVDRQFCIAQGRTGTMSNLRTCCVRVGRRDAIHYTTNSPPPLSSAHPLTTLLPLPYPFPPSTLRTIFLQRSRCLASRDCRGTMIEHACREWVPMWARYQQTLSQFWTEKVSEEPVTPYRLCMSRIYKSEWAWTLKSSATIVSLHCLPRFLSEVHSCFHLSVSILFSSVSIQGVPGAQHAHSQDKCS